MDAEEELSGVWQARIVTLFPDAFPGVLGLSLTGKAMQEMYNARNQEHATMWTVSVQVPATHSNCDDTIRCRDQIQDHARRV